MKGVGSRIPASDPALEKADEPGFANSTRVRIGLELQAGGVEVGPERRFALKE
jgi:hypothetical protein